MNPCVAVVEDNPDNRLLVRVLLEDSYEIVEFESAPEALAGLPSTSAAVVLMDISLPGMDGTEALNHLRANDQLRNLPVIALTAHAMAGDRQRYLDLGFDDYVAKPIVDEALLLEAIARCLSK